MSLPPQEKNQKLLQIKQYLLLQQNQQVIQNAQKLQRIPYIDLSTLYDIKGIAHFRLGQYNQAYQCYKKAKNNKKNSNYNNNQALSLYYLDRNQEAYQLLKQSIKVMKNPIYFKNMAKVCEMLGIVDQATQSFSLSQKYSKYNVNHDDQQKGLIFNFLWEQDENPIYINFQSLNNAVYIIAKDMTKDIDNKKLTKIQLKTKLIKKNEQILNKIQELYQLSQQKGFILSQKLLILKQLTFQFKSTFKQMHNLMSDMLSEKKDSYICSFSQSYGLILKQLISLPDKPNKQDSQKVIKNFIDYKKKALSQIKKPEIKLTTPGKPKQQKKQKLEIQQDECNQKGLSGKKKPKTNPIFIQSDNQSRDEQQKQKKQIENKKQQQKYKKQSYKYKKQPQKHKKQPQIKQFQTFNNVIMTKKQQFYQQQIENTKVQSHCQWQLKISNDDLQCRIAKPCQSGQYKDRIIIYQKKNIQKTMAPLTQEAPYQVSITYSTLIWLIKIIALIKGQRRSIIYKEYGVIKKILVQDLITKIGFLMNCVTNNHRQDILCSETLKTISTIYGIKNQDFSQNLERMQNAISALNQNFDQIKSAFIDRKICQALSETKISPIISKDHTLFRNFLFKDKDLSISQQTLIQNLAIILIYSQKLKKDPEYQFIAQILIDCFEKQQASQKFLIIKRAVEQIQGKSGLINKIFNIFRKN